MEKLLSKLEAIERSLIRLIEKKKLMLEKAQLSSCSRVNFLKWLYPGVTIASNDTEFTVTEAQEGPATVEFDPIESKFSVVEYQPVECAFAPRDEYFSLGE